MSSPHTCDVVRQNQEAVGFMKKCPFKSIGGKTKTKMCQEQVEKLMGVMQLTLSAQTPEDYTIGSEFEFDGEETAATQKTVMPQGSKIFAEVKAYALQIKSFVQRIFRELHRGASSCLPDQPKAIKAEHVHGPIHVPPRAQMLDIRAVPVLRPF